MTQQHRLSVHLAVASSIVAAACLGSTASSCGSDSRAAPEKGDAAVGVVDASKDAATWDSVQIEPPSASLTATLGGAPAQQLFKAFGSRGGVRQEISGECSWSLSVKELGTLLGPVFTTAGRGGASNVNVSCAGAAAAAKLDVMFTGEVIAPTAPANTPALFKAATLGTDPTRAPRIDYPIAGAVMPLNIPPIDAQWSAAGNDLFRVTLASTHVALSFYTTTWNLEPAADVWSAVSASASQDTLSITVEGVLFATPAQRFKSAVVPVEVSRDRIDETAIYYWVSNKGELTTQTFGEITPPTPVRGKCTSCHSVSRSGRRVGYSRCLADNCADMFVGFMKYDVDKKVFADTVNADDRLIAGSYTTFSPVGYPFADDAHALALVTRKGGTFELYDPDTGLVVPSNVASASVGAGTGSALMADWSADGKAIAFATTPAADWWIDLAGGSLSTMSYSFAGGAHVFGAPKKIVAGPLTIGGGTYSNFFFPSWSPDGKLIVFNGARDEWRDSNDARKPGQRLFLTDGTGSFVVDLANINGPGDLNVTWPHWAPASSNDYYWVVFSSERNYGHRLTSANSAAACKSSGVVQCKQIWIGAVSKSKLPTAGAMNAPDPSAAPVWMPGQAIDANNISPYWSLPTTGIPK